MTHRGPDAAGSASFPMCSLGHRRLRIIDLSDAADQPISNEDSTVWVVFNGEIYNFVELRAELERAGHRFRSVTDSEVLVHLYEQEGSRLVERLRGMFAFAVWDERHQTLLLARDRLGIKPLYYRQEGAELSFASEARSLSSVSDEVNPEALAGYLRLGWVPGSQTIFNGVQELPPGHLLAWKDGKTTLSRWWTPHVPAEAGPPLKEVLRDAFARHLVADVPLGLFLSAGVDSAALAYLAAQTGSNVETLTVSFDTGPDEAAEAAALSKQLGLRHTDVHLKGTDVLENLSSIVAGMDQPTVDGVNSWVISRAARRSGLTVALSGLGGDELFGGYSTFRRVPVLAAAGRAAGIIPASLRRKGAEAVIRRSRSHPLRRAAGAVAEGGWAEAYASMRGVTGPDEFRRLVPWAKENGLEGLSFSSAEDGLEPVTELELSNYLPQQLLRDTDAMSMAHSLEVRVPLLDDEVVASALSLRALDRSSFGKRRLAEAVDPALVPLTALPKRTFTLPFEDWLRGPLKEPAREALDRLGNRGLGIDSTESEAIWARHTRGREHWRTVWAMVVLELWVDARAKGKS